MDLMINVRNIRVNSISTLGSLNVGKAIFVRNRSAVTECPKGNYEEQEQEQNEINSVKPPMPLPKLEPQTLKRKGIRT